jgi:hypothetical protein
VKTAIFRNCLIASLLIVGTAPPVLAAGITIANSATVTLVGSPTITTVSVGIYGTLSAGAGTIKISGNYTNIGTFTAGTGTVDFTATSGTQYLTSGGTGTGKLFYHLTHSGAGTLYLLTNAIDIDGNFNNSAGIFDANGLAISCAGNWTNSATATYTHNNNSVTLDGTNQTLTGPTTFYDLTKIVTSAATLTFDNTAIQTITHNLTLQGASGQLLSLRSDAAAAYNLTLQAGGTQSLSYLDVQYSDASGGVELAAGPTSVNSENNVNWTFLILSISVLPSTWGVGTVDVGTTQVTTSGNKINVTNNGNVSETFILQIYDEDDRNEWTHSPSETGAGSNVYVLSGIFCATSDSPTGNSFNEGDSDDVLTTSAQVATSSKFAYTGGGDDAVSVPASGQLSLWLRLDMPTAVTGTHAYDQHIITVRISCQQP